MISPATKARAAELAAEAPPLTERQIAALAAVLAPVVKIVSRIAP